MGKQKNAALPRQQENHEMKLDHHPQSPSREKPMIRSIAVVLALNLSATSAFAAEPAKCADKEYNDTVSSMKAADKVCEQKDAIKAEFVQLGCDEAKVNAGILAVCPEPAKAKADEKKAEISKGESAKDEPAKKSDLIKLCRQAGSVDGLNRLIKRLNDVGDNASKNLTNARSFKDDIEDGDKLAFENLTRSFTKTIEVVEKWKAEDRNATASTLLDYNQCLRALGVDPANAVNIDKAAKELEAARAAQNALNGNSDVAAIKAAADKVKEKEAILAATLLDNSQPMDCHGKDVEMKMQLEALLKDLDPKDAAPAKKVLAEIKNDDPCQIVITKVMAAAQALPDKVYNRLMLRQLFPEPGPKDTAVALVPDAKGTSYSVGPADAKDGIRVVYTGLIGRATNTGITLGVGYGSFFQTGRNSLGVTGASVQAVLIQAGWKFNLHERLWIEPSVVGGPGIATGYHPNNQGNTPSEKRFVGVLGGGASVGTNVGIFSPYVVAQLFGAPGFGYSVGVGTQVHTESAGAFDASLRWTSLDTEVLSGFRASRIRLDGGLGFTLGWKF